MTLVNFQHCIEYIDDNMAMDVEDVVAIRCLDCEEVIDITLTDAFKRSQVVETLLRYGYAWNIYIDKFGNMSPRVTF